MAESKNIKNQKKSRPGREKSLEPAVIWSWGKKGLEFLREARNELRKVVWPPRKQVLTSTGVVLVLVVVAASFLGLVDFVLARVVRLILGVDA
ncbi:MAG: preprotein translocase subunit SecE [Desulfarculales bacterium]|jgi:preprotein translocase subunit SecE|nr:preprotein translocase subunit SecE [Desulfarculales bacterium]